MIPFQLVRDNTFPWNKKSVVFVHGIGDHPLDYAAPLVEVFRKQDSAGVDAARWYAVAYDFVNDAMAEKIKLLQNNISDPAVFSGNAVAELLLDVVDYLGTKDLKNWINTAYKRTLVEIVQRGFSDNVMQGDHEVYIVSHSLGTVVSYEILHDVLNDPQTLGLSKNFRVKCFFTFGSPLAFIKKNDGLIPGFAETHLKARPLGRPARINAFTKKTQTNVLDWFNFRHALDPVASLVPLDMNSSNNSLSKETSVFKAFHTGANAHAFLNYATDYAAFIMETIRG